MIRFKIDENLPMEIRDRLRRAGYDALTVLDQELGGRPDAQIAAICQQEGRALLTLDTDFTNILRYPPEDHSGIIVLRLPRLDKHAVLEVLERLLPLLEEQPPAKRLWIVEEGRVRVRG